MPLSIHDLPIELLPHIFRWISPTDRKDILLAHVCGVWREALHRTPEFWAGLLTVQGLVTTRNHQRDAELWYSFVDRTLSQPLRLLLGGHAFHLMKAIPQHLPRITLLHVEWLRVYPKDAQGHLLAIGPLPALEHLQLSCVSPAPLTDFLDFDPAALVGSRLLANEHPRLRHLEVNPDFFIPSMVSASLRTLIIHKGHMSIVLLTSALANCPNLESLRLNHAYKWGVLNTLPQIDLPRLRDYFLDYSDNRYVHETPVRDILGCIRCPSFAQLALDIGSPNPVRVLFPNSNVSPIMRVLTRLVIQSSDDSNEKVSLSYSLLAQGFVDSDRSQIPRLHVGVWGVNTHYPLSSILMSLIIPSVGFPAVTDLDILLHCGRGIPTPMTSPEWNSLLQAFPALISLTAHIASESCEELLRGLFFGRLLPVPRLQKLAISCTQAPRLLMNDLASMCQVRAGRGSPLRRLELRSSSLESYNRPLWPWEMEHLRRWVEEVDVRSASGGPSLAMDLRGVWLEERFRRSASRHPWALVRAGS
ncbi:hypothetical protein L226DRAFT_530765 [Lentinus tigrinus ALCF2SS1-7]|uniref:F-box domain-containing protein n=1 Tax=Lentinus tigrinus ALCF2SS1-6 TaxID=1328759 RepID=A0A5C2SRK5_9APHY|nr:hypothetical protein L227DRAFT_570991 [Lentinus tigrinus ALCF2SS1-6]RPD78888.1 hypothetical protein L226DRAFT_530765 [Lentinus tigrinus ALCF2SS1-7]